MVNADFYMRSQFFAGGNAVYNTYECGSLFFNDWTSIFTSWEQPYLFNVFANGGTFSYDWKTDLWNTMWLAVQVALVGWTANTMSAEGDNYSLISEAMRTFYVAFLLFQQIYT